MKFNKKHLNYWNIVVNRKRKIYIITGDKQHMQTRSHIKKPMGFKTALLLLFTFRYPLFIFLLFLFMGVSAFAEENTPKKTIVKTGAFFNPNDPEDAYTRQVIDFARKHPGIEVQKWGGISIPGGGRASLMMAIAGKTAPDIGWSWFHTIRNEIKQQFLYPLNEWIGFDTNGNGQIDDEEATWPGWKKVPPLWRKVATVDGKVYGIPEPVKSITAILFRIDMVKAAGLDPNKPPQTWDEFYYWCQKLTDPNRTVPGAIIQSGQKAICLPAAGQQFLPWIQSAGGEPFLQYRTSPKTGKKYAFPLYETKFITPDGENLSNEKSTWKATFASKEGLKAADFIYKLRWGKWLIDPETKKPVTLSEEDVVNGFVMIGNRKLEFSDEDVIKGVARSKGSQPGTNDADLLGRGEVAMMLASVSDLKEGGNNLEIFNVTPEKKNEFRAEMGDIDTTNYYWGWFMISDIKLHLPKKK